MAASNAKLIELARQELEWRRCFEKPSDLQGNLFGCTDEALIAAELEKLAHFIVHHCMIWTKEGGDPIPFDLWECQKEALEAFITQRLVIILKTRQLGMSWLSCAYLLWLMMRESNVHAYFSSIGQKEASEQAARTKFIYENLPVWMQSRIQLGAKGKKDNESLKEFSNNSCLHIMATSKKAGHGASPRVWVIDEFARNEQDVRTMRAVQPAVGQIGQVIIISTADGLGNKFAEMWFEAKKGESNYFPIFFAAQRHPYYTPEFLELEKLNYVGDLQGYLEAYPSTWEEAFAASNKCPFESEAIKYWMSYIRERKVAPKVGRLKLADDGVTVEFVPDRHGPLMIYKDPIRDDVKKGIRGHRYSQGVDIAQGLTKGDYSAQCVVDSDTNETVALFRQKIAPEVYGLQVELLAKFYNNAWVTIEVNKFAEPIVQDLKESCYPFLYTRERREKWGDQPTMEIGFYSSSKTKPNLVTTCRREFHEPDTRLQLKVYSEVILNEMTTYEEDDRGSFGASGQNNHDDCVMALMLALEGKKTQPASITARPRERQYDWRSL